MTLDTFPAGEVALLLIAVSFAYRIIRNVTHDEQMARIEARLAELERKP